MYLTAHTYKRSKSPCENGDNVQVWKRVVLVLKRSAYKTRCCEKTTGKRSQKRNKKEQVSTEQRKKSKTGK